MDPQERAFAIRCQRKAIMSNLLAVYPGSLPGEALYLAQVHCFPDYDRNRAVKDLYYLEEKGYAVRKHPLTKESGKHIEWRKALWALTAAGNEVANDLINDPAMEM